MFTNIKRNLRILNKDVLETAWLKCILDDIPKQKHIITLQKCLSGEIMNSKEALKKLTFRMLYAQKPLNALKTYYLVHIFQETLLPYITDKTNDYKVNDSADILIQSVGKLYYNYLICMSNLYEQINIAFKMRRQLEVLIIKLDLPIIKCITIKLILDLIALYESIKVFDTDQNIKAAKQVKRFIEISKCIQMPQELKNKIGSLKFQELFIPIENKKKLEILNLEKLDFIKIEEQKLSTSTQIEEESMEYQHSRNKSLQTSPNRKRPLTSTARAVSIRDGFFVPSQGPLSFLMPQ